MTASRGDSELNGLTNSRGSRLTGQDVIRLSPWYVRTFVFVICYTTRLRQADCVYSENLVERSNMFVKVQRKLAVTSGIFWVLKRREKLLKKYTWSRRILISDYKVTLGKFRNNCVCFSFQISFHRNRPTFAASRHVPWALSTPKMHFGMFRAQSPVLTVNVVLRRREWNEMKVHWLILSAFKNRLRAGLV